MNLKVNVKNSDYYPKTMKMKWLLVTKKLWIGLIIDIVIGFLFALNLLPFKAQYDRYIGNSILFVTALILLLLFYGLYRYMTVGYKWFKLNRDANTDIELNFTADGIFFKDYRGTTTLDWNNYKRYRRFMGYLFIMKKNPGDGITFKESMISKEDMNELLQFMHNRFALGK